MTATGKPATAPEKSKTANKKQREPNPRVSKKSGASSPRKASKPSAGPKRRRATRSTSVPAGSAVTARPDAKASAAPAVPAGRTGQVSATVSPLSRQRMIAEAAYFKAQSRGFTGGNLERDWFEAEREVDALLNR